MPISKATLETSPFISGGTKPQGKVERLCGELGNYLIAGLVVLVITFSFMAANSRIVHWFVFPAAACGVLMGADAVRWLRGSIDPFDPKGLIGLVTFYGFFIVPMLHVYWQIHGREFTGDPRYWLGVMACLNALGLVFYKLTQRWSFKHTAPVKTVWKIVPVRLLPILGMATVIAFFAQFYFYFVVLRRVGRGSEGGAQFVTKGYGWLLMLGDPLLILFLTGFITWTVIPRRNRNWVIIALVLAVASVGQLIWVGLRGSRSATVEGVFWVVGLIHCYWRRLRPLHLLLGLICLVGFLYFYGFYKSGGWQAVKALEAGESLERMEQRTGRNIYGLLLGDLARADVQAVIANLVVEGHTHYRLRYGRTYLEALSKLIPYTVWEALGVISFKNNWNKGKAFIDLIEGPGRYHPVYNRNTNVFGLSGEAMLNFGVLGVPPAWLIFGLAVGWLRRKRETMAGDDTRWPLMLFLSYMAAMATVSDLDNLVFGIFKVGCVIFFCIFFWSHRAERVPV